MPSRMDALVDAYARHVGLPWESGLAHAQRVWFVIYPKEEERRLRYRVEAFAQATKGADRRWICVDITHAFSDWIDGEKYRDAYFRNLKTLAPKLPLFLPWVAENVVGEARRQGADENTVVAVLGASSLFGFALVSDLVPRVASELPGRVLVFFPGSREGNVYRLLDAREGWNYLAIPITASDEGIAPC